METRRKRTKRFKLEPDYVVESGADSDSPDLDESESVRKSRIRDSNKEHARRMTILQSWSDYWSEYTTREGDAYPKEQAKSIIKRSKKITCPIPTCRKPFTSIGGLRYHYARCNIERSFTCKVCSPVTQLTTRGDLLRHMVRNHYENLPELNEDQKSIAHSFLSYESRSIDINTRINLKRKYRMDNELATTCEATVKMYQELVSRVFTPESLDNRPFNNWSIHARDWELLSYELGRRRFHPPERESPRVRVDKDDNWLTLATGCSSSSLSSLKKSSKFTSLFYTGGITTASAWQPKPVGDQMAKNSPDTIALAVDCVSMDKNLSYKDVQGKEMVGCIQFWRAEIVHDGTVTQDSKVNPANFELKTSLQFMVGHNHGRISDMKWCPLGASWQTPVKAINPKNLARSGLLALACGDGQIRIIGVPHTQYLLGFSNSRMSDGVLESCPTFRVKPIAILMPPGLGPSTDYQSTACTTISWNFECSQKMIVAGYANGNVALFDLSNLSPVLYTNKDDRHIYRPQKSWLAHCMPITSVAAQTRDSNRTFVATGSRDRQLKVWNSMDLNSCLTTEKSPITKVFKDFRYRGFVIAAESAFTSFNNRVSYKYPVCDGFNTATITTHRSTVWGLDGSSITSSVAVSDEAGEVMFTPQIVNKMSIKRDKEVMMVGHSLYTMIPRPLNKVKDQREVLKLDSTLHNINGINPTVDQGVVLIEEPALKDDNIIEYETTDANMIELRPLEPVNEGSYKITEPLNMHDIKPKEENDADDDSDFGGDFSLERNVANKPTKFLLPPDHRAIETYTDFKTNFGLEFIEYSSSMTRSSRIQLPESCTRASNLNDLYCDRACDYPFSSIRNVEWSPNAHNFSFLLSVSHIGLCRLEKVQIIQQTFQGPVEAMIDRLIRGPIDAISAVSNAKSSD